MQNKKDIVAYVLQTLRPDIGSSRCTLILLQFEPIAHLLSNQFLHHPMLHNWIPWVQHLKERFSIGSPLNFRYQTMTLSLTMKVISWQQQKQTFTSKTKPPQAKCPAQKQKWQVWCAYHTILLPSSLSPPPPVVPNQPFLTAWGDITINNWVLTIIQVGYTIEFNSCPVVPHFVSTPQTPLFLKETDTML